MMGVKKVIISPGNGVDFPEKGDLVVLKWVEKMFGDVYGRLTSLALRLVANTTAKRIDSSDSRGGSLTYQLGVGDLIRGTHNVLGLEALIITDIFRLGSGITTNVVE